MEGQNGPGLKEREGIFRKGRGNNWVKMKHREGKS